MFRAFANRIPYLTVEEAIERIQPLNLTPHHDTTTQAASSEQAAGDGSGSSKDEETRPVDEELLQSGAKAHEERRKLYAHGNECHCVTCKFKSALI